MAVHRSICANFRRFFFLSNLLLLLLTMCLPAFAQGSQPQTISFLPISDRPVSSAPFQVVALSSANLPVNLSVAGPATLTSTERTLSLTGVGAVTVTATQAGNAQYAPTKATLTFQSQAVTPAITSTPAAIPYGTH